MSGDGTSTMTATTITTPPKVKVQSVSGVKSFLAGGFGGMTCVLVGEFSLLKVNRLNFRVYRYSIYVIYFLLSHPFSSFFNFLRTSIRFDQGNFESHHRLEVEFQIGKKNNNSFYCVLFVLFRYAYKRLRRVSIVVCLMLQRKQLRKMDSSGKDFFES